MTVGRLTSTFVRALKGDMRSEVGTSQRNGCLQLWQVTPEAVEDAPPSGKIRTTLMFAM